LPGADRGPMIARMARRVEVPPLADSAEPVDLAIWSDRCREDTLQTARCSAAEAGQGDPVRQRQEQVPARLLAMDNNGAVVKTDASGDVVEVYAGAPAADELLRELSTLPKLRLLDVEATTRVTPAGLAHVAAMSALESLNLYDLRVSDNDLRHVAALRGLRELSLAENAITDAGLERSRISGTLRDCGSTATGLATRGSCTWPA